jgi:hypothetical protein
MARVDAHQLLASASGQGAWRAVRKSVPLPPSATLELERGVSSAQVAAYSLQTPDLLAVLTGTFDARGLERNAERAPQTENGARIATVQVSGYALITAQHVTLVVIDSHTALLGAEARVRAALNSLTTGVTAGGAAKTLAEFTTGGAAIEGGLSLDPARITDVLRLKVPFTKGLKAVKFHTDFSAQVVSFVGTLKYANEEAARRAEPLLRDLPRTLQTYGALMNVPVLNQPIRKLDLQIAHETIDLSIDFDAQVIVWFVTQAQN